MIKTLTKKQEKDLNKFYNERLEIGRSTKPINHKSVRKAISDLYVKLGEKRPTVLVFSSPLMCLLAYGVLKNIKLEDSQLYSQLHSQLRSQLDSQLDSQLYSQLHSQLRSQLDSQLDSQ